VVLEGDRVVAFVVTPEPERAKETAVETPCTRPAGNREKRLFGVCISNAGELARASDDELTLLARETEKPIATVRIPGLVFAGALRNPLDGRDDLVAVVKHQDSQATQWSVVVYRLHDGKLVRVSEPSTVYQLTPNGARWVNAELRDVELYLELTSRSDAIEVGGLLTTRAGDKIRDIVVISPVSVSRRRAKSATHEPADPTSTDATTTSEQR
jgi:hypothetical protein